MKWFTLILVCAVIATVSSEPDPKKYKADEAEKDKKSESTLTDDEKTFLREVEKKFGVKSQVPIDNEQNVTDTESKNSTEKTPLPAVIAIEIVNDTDSKPQEKRTIDANLGYGYRTNDGYTYTYFGKPKQEKGKFVIYPYSQQDSIVPSEYNKHRGGYSQSVQSSGKNSETTSVEIQPSQAFELVTVKDDNYDDGSKSLENSQEYTKETSSLHPSTLYTTYNGEELSGLSGKFPSLMSNYFVEPKKLLSNPQYQNIGLTQDHLSTSGLDHNRPVVPVLVLRVPSSYLKNPTTELYANLPNNYPHSNYLNNVNLRDMVNQYFKKNGYNFAPQVMSYQKPHIATPAMSSSASYNSEPQQYSNPHVQPSYTQSDYSGIQYSAVKPVMAKYPSSFNRQKYLSSQIQSQHRRPIQQQKYEPRYHYQVPQSAAHEQVYYDHSLYQKPQQSSVASYEQQSEYVTPKPSTLDVVGNANLGKFQYQSNQDASVHYDSNSHLPSSQTESSSIESEYDYSKESQSNFSPHQTLTQDYSSQPLSEYTSSQLSEYLAKNQFTSKDAINAYSTPASYAEEEQQSYSGGSPTQGYDYSKTEENINGNSFVLPENYPSKDHTIATVLPFSYKQPKNTNTATVQTVSYVTPMPSSKYQSRFRIMVPQTVLTGQEKVTYVNSMPMHYTKAGIYNQNYNPEEYSAGQQYNHQLSNQNTPSFSKSYYHSYPKRMVRPDNKSGASSISSQSKKVNDGRQSS